MLGPRYLRCLSLAAASLVFLLGSATAQTDPSLAMQIKISGQTRGFVSPDAADHAIISPIVNLTRSFGPLGGDMIWTITDTATKQVAAQGVNTMPMIQSTKVGTYLLRVEARRPTGALLAAASAPLVFTAPIKPIVTVTAPQRTGVGLPSTFVANVKVPFPYTPSTFLWLKPGTWTLPDGTTQEASYDDRGRPILYYTPPIGSTVDPATGLSAPYKVTYSTSFSGFESSTTVTATASSQNWAYRFPQNWTVKATVAGALDSNGVPRAPAVVRAVASATEPKLVPFVSGLKFQWGLSPSIPVISATGATLNARLINEGTFPISVHITDDYGNAADAVAMATVSAPPPLAMAITTANQSKWTHGPVKLGITSKVSGGIGILDPVSRYVFSVDGSVVSDQTSNTASVTLPTGPHTVDVTATTQRGLTVQKSLDVNVPAPDVPTCSVTATGTPAVGSTIALTLKATSTTGYIAKYYWTTSSSSTPLPVTMNKMAFKMVAGGPTTYFGHAVTDAGLECSASWSP